MDINEQIKEIKNRIILLTDIYPYTKREINLLTIVYLAFIMLDPTIEDLLDEVLKTTFFIFAKESSIEDFKSVMTCITKDEEKRLESLTDCFYGRKIINHELVGFPLIVIIEHTSLSEELDSIIHEFKHAINEVIPKFDGEKYFSGLSLEDEYYSFFRNIDEAFNSFLVKIYLDNISHLKSLDIKDPEIKELLANFGVYHYHYCYQNYVRRCAPLFKSKKLFWLFYNASLYKNMAELYQALEEVFDNKVSALEFFEALDKGNRKTDMVLKLVNKSFLQEEFMLPKK